MTTISDRIIFLDLSERFDVSSEAVVINISSGNLRKDELVAAIASQGCFPDYFGYNWDALLDCLQDLSWIKAPRIYIRHFDAFLASDDAERRTYLDVLFAATRCWIDWNPPVEAIQSQNWRLLSHELFLVFPSVMRPEISERLDAFERDGRDHH